MYKLKKEIAFYYNHGYIISKYGMMCGNVHDIV